MKRIFLTMTFTLYLKELGLKLPAAIFPMSARQQYLDLFAEFIK